MQNHLLTAIEAALEAGKGIMKVYGEGDFQVEFKDDWTPLTLADKKSHEIIQEKLSKFDIPIISEESVQIDHKVRRRWEECWIVDPLDGTKEFIKKNGEFTVNIALIKAGKPLLGVIYAPALSTLYFGDVAEKKAFKAINSQGQTTGEEILKTAQKIKPMAAGDFINVVGSRSHMNDDTLQFIDDLKKRHQKEVKIISKGSSLKFCLVAEGEAQFYPRYAPTMEWDTAAGQAICEAVGLTCRIRSTGESMSYNREQLLNDHFLVSHEG